MSDIEIKPTVGKCPMCGGTGKVFAMVNNKNEVVQCLICSGTGRVIGVPKDYILVVKGEQVRMVAIIKAAKPGRESGLEKRLVLEARKYPKTFLHVFMQEED